MTRSVRGGSARTAALRCAAMGAALAAMLALFAGAPARAQAVCVTSGADETCTNTGTNVGGITTSTAGNATTDNSGIVTAGIITTSNTAGNATTTNSGSVAAGIVTDTSVGNAATLNSGSVGAGIITDSITGNSTATNSGSVGTSILTQAIAGNAITTNTGSVGTSINTSAITGNAVTINSGSVGATGIDTFANAGNATSINSGAVAGNVFTQATTGNATATNAGSIGGILETLAGTGNAITFNSGLVTGEVITEVTTGSATLTNSGTMLGPVFATASSGTASLINTGAIIDAVVVASANGSANVANTGAIVGQLNVHASTMATVTNAGTISDFGSVAISFSGTADTLNLMAGSNITGAIDLIGSNDTVNFLSGNHNLTFNTLAGATVNGPDPFVVSGNRAVAIDPTPFGLADRNLMDFTRAVSGILDGIGGGAAASGPLSSAFAPVETPAGRIDEVFATIPGLGYASDQAPVFKAPTFVTQDGRAIWARGFGGERTQDPDQQSGMVGAHTAFFGGAVGFDMVARRDLRLGLFAGGGESRLTLDGNLGFTNSDMAFGGIYGRWNFVSPLGRDSFLDFSLHGGGGNNSTSRTVNNNLVAGGLEFATANYNSSYISPDMKFGVNIPLWAQYTLTPTVRVRYVAGFFGGYTESGTTAPLTVASRTIQDFEERGEVKLTRATPVGPDLLLTSTHVGVIGLERAGDTTVNTTLLGINLPFVTPGRNTVGGLVTGGGFEWRTREGVSFFGASESIWFSDSSTVWSAKGGVRVAF